MSEAFAICISGDAVRRASAKFCCWYYGIEIRGFRIVDRAPRAPVFGIMKFAWVFKVFARGLRAWDRALVAGPPVYEKFASHFSRYPILSVATKRPVDRCGQSRRPALCAGHRQTRISRCPKRRSRSYQRRPRPSAETNSMRDGFSVRNRENLTRPKRCAGPFRPSSTARSSRSAAPDPYPSSGFRRSMSSRQSLHLSDRTRRSGPVKRTVRATVPQPGNVAWAKS